MKIGVTSDLHGRVSAGLLRALEGCDVILVAGDFEDKRVVDELEVLAPVLAVCGNCDDGPTKRVPFERCEEFDGVRVCMTHGDRFAKYDHFNRALVEHFAGRKPHIIIHGHTHKAKCKQRDGVTIINPGSPYRPRNGGPSCAIIETAPGGTFTARIKDLD